MNGPTFEPHPCRRYPDTRNASGLANPLASRNARLSGTDAFLDETDEASRKVCYRRVWQLRTVPDTCLRERSMPPSCMHSLSNLRRGQRKACRQCPHNRLAVRQRRRPSPRILAKNRLRGIPVEIATFAGTACRCTRSSNGPRSDARHCAIRPLKWTGLFFEEVLGPLTSR
ncbi:hypothetical protein J2W42_003004 [Rhizobium tibeticum]|nr:hypothetical protein [Rhizobium tibeticum]